jgi:hypothetical protein
MCVCALCFCACGRLSVVQGALMDRCEPTYTSPLGCISMYVGRGNGNGQLGRQTGMGSRLIHRPLIWSRRTHGTGWPRHGRSSVNQSLGHGVVPSPFFDTSWDFHVPAARVIPLASPPPLPSPWRRHGQHGPHLGRGGLASWRAGLQESQGGLTAPRLQLNGWGHHGGGGGRVLLLLLLLHTYFV